MCTDQKNEGERSTTISLLVGHSLALLQARMEPIETLNKSSSQQLAPRRDRREASKVIVPVVFAIFVSSTLLLHATTTANVSLLFENNRSPFVQPDIAAFIPYDIDMNTTTQSPRSFRSQGESSIHGTENCTNATLLYQSQCVSHKALELARPFPDHPYPSWLISNEPYKKSSPVGILLVKTFKAGSTTAAGVALRLASHLEYTPTSRFANQRQNNMTSNTNRTETLRRVTRPSTLGPLSLVRFDHTPGQTYGNRNRQRSFLFTSVRDPVARAISRIFYTMVSQGGHKPDAQLLLQRLNSTHPAVGSTSDNGGFQVRYVSLRHLTHTAWSMTNPEMVLDSTQVQATVAQIMNDYDFILLAERMDESLVAMSFIMGVDVADVLVSSSKLSGSSYHGIRRRTGDLVCVKLIKAPPRNQMPLAVQDYLNSNEWRARNYGDYLLHQAANISLDQTIDRIGRGRFELELSRYRRLNAKANQECKNATFTPCSDHGIPQKNKAKMNCYSRDKGCGFACIDAIVSRDTINTEST